MIFWSRLEQARSKVETGGVSPNWSHDFLAKSPCFFGAKLTPKVTPSWSCTMDTEKY